MKVLPFMLLEFDVDEKGNATIAKQSLVTDMELTWDDLEIVDFEPESDEKH